MSKINPPTERERNLARWLRPTESQVATPVAGAVGLRTKGLKSSSLIQKFKESTPSRICVGRVGTRYLTPLSLKMRADHAIAKDAVYSEIHDSFAQELGCLALLTECKDREDYLLNPGKGRRLSSEYLALLQREGTRGADVQIIVADGLSAWATERNVPGLLPILETTLQSAGFTIGKRIFVRFARVGVQDDVGVALGARSTVILLGERPGLGTGDSLSAYIAYGPKLEQDNAEKNCISNIRAMGISAQEAANDTAAILKSAFACGKGGVNAQ